jgi:hypothetical protein
MNCHSCLVTKRDSTHQNPSPTLCVIQTSGVEPLEMAGAASRVVFLSVSWQWSWSLTLCMGEMNEQLLSDILSLPGERER